jgi:predicted Zn-dependent protease
LSHLDRGHHLTRVRRLRSAQQAFAGTRPGFTPEQFFVAGSRMFRLWMQPFQPEAEAEADLDGARWAYRAGYDPREMAKLLSAAQQKRPPRIPMPEFLQSHPAADERCRAILELYDRLQRDAPNPRLYLGTENLRRKVAWKQRQFDE